MAPAWKQNEWKINWLCVPLARWLARQSCQGTATWLFCVLVKVKTDGHEEENLNLLVLSDSLTHLLRNVLETVYHTIEDFKAKFVELSGR